MNGIQTFNDVKDEIFEMRANDIKNKEHIKECFEQLRNKCPGFYYMGMGQDFLSFGEVVAGEEHSAYEINLGEDGATALHTLTHLRYKYWYDLETEKRVLLDIIQAYPYKPVQYIAEIMLASMTYYTGI